MRDPGLIATGLCLAIQRNGKSKKIGFRANKRLNQAFHSRAYFSLINLRVGG
jgi:hypothetical protein